MQDRLPPDRRTSCNARPDHTSGSKADPKPRILKVRSSINSGHSPKRPSGLFLLKKLKILRVNQDHRSASSSRQRIDHPHLEGLTTRLVPVEVDLKQQIFDVCSSPQQRTFTKGAVTSALCHEQTSSALFDRLVGGRQQRWRHIASTNRRERVAANAKRLSY
jgi:hypothetical protein